jgi:hypothetical protein
MKEKKREEGVSLPMRSQNRPSQETYEKEQVKIKAWMNYTYIPPKANENQA